MATCNLAFVSYVLRPGKDVIAEIPEGCCLNICQAALATDNADVKGSLQLRAVSTSIENEPIDAVLGTLRAGVTDQMQLGLCYGYDVPVKFKAVGNLKGSCIHLSGYLQPGPDDGDDDGEHDDEDDDDDDDDDDDEDGDEGWVAHAQRVLFALSFP